MNTKRTSLAMAVLITIINLNSAAAGTAGRISGPMYNPQTHHWYCLLSASTWTEAELEAVRLGGHLVTIENREENDWVLRTFGNFGGSPKMIWLGLTDPTGRAQWTWVSTGKRPDFWNWAPGEPGSGACYIDMYPANSIMPAPAGTWNGYANLTRQFGLSIHGVVELEFNPSASVAAATALTEPIVNPANGHSYILLSPSTWTEAEQNAKASNGDLVTIDDAAENEWVLSIFGDASRMIWTGLTDPTGRGKWTWISNGKRPDYWNWAPGEPGSGACYIDMYSSNSVMGAPGGTWNGFANLSRQFGLPIQGVVEIDPTTQLPRSRSTSSDASQSTLDGSTPTLRVTWGRLKATYR